jgi:MoxR-like ATPase
MKQWWIYQGTGQPHDAIEDLPDPPSWRAFADHDRRERRFGHGSFRIDDHEIDLVNAALFLRRPLLVTGPPGAGKSSLAFAIAHELQLEPVLQWPINSRSTLREGLYDYDAIGRLQETSVRQAWAPTDPVAAGLAPEERPGPPDIGPYITLRALGTALLPSKRPRVLLVDEIDKGDIDLPNDLLNIFEEGSFTIPELARLKKRQPEAEVRTADDEDEDGRGRAVLTHGEVRCEAFPIVILTSNGERDFPPPFLRRCLQLEFEQPGKDKLVRIVEGHLERDMPQDMDGLVEEFVRRRDEQRQILAPDQLLSAAFILTSGRGAGKTSDERKELLDMLFRSLGEVGGG